MRRAVMWMGFLMPMMAFGAPRVPKTDLQIVPPAWIEAHQALEKAVADAAIVVASAKDAEAAASASARAAQTEREGADDAVKTHKVAYKAAKKSKDRKAARAQSAAWELAKQKVVEAERAEGVADADLEVAKASLKLAEAVHDLAAAKLEQARAQAVSDAGGLADVARFDAAVLDGIQAHEAATVALAEAESSRVLAGQR